MKKPFTATMPVFLAVCLSTLLLSGCSLDYKMARVRERMASQQERPTVLVTAAPELEKVVTMQPVTAPVPVHNEALAAVRYFAGHRSLALTLLKVVEDPDAGGRKTKIFQDNLGAVYWVDSDTQQIVQWTPGVRADVGPEITTDRLREAAISLARNKSLAFGSQFKRLVLTQSTQDSESVTFHWEDPDLASRFLEVVLRTDGQILGYQNTLDIPKK